MTCKWWSHSTLPASACLCILVSQCKDSAFMSGTITSWVRCNLTYYFQQIIRLGICSVVYIKFKAITTEPRITRSGWYYPSWNLSGLFLKRKNTRLYVYSIAVLGIHYNGPSIQSQPLQCPCEFTTNCWSYFTCLLPSEFTVIPTSAGSKMASEVQEFIYK